MKSERPTPAVTPINEGFFSLADKGVLSLQHCTACDSRWYLPSSNCPNCPSTDLDWVEVSGQGSLWSWIVMHQPYLRAFKDEVPYVVAFVQLREGVEIIAGLADVDPADLHIDMPLEVVFEELGQDAVPMPFFRPVAA